MSREYAVGIGWHTGGIVSEDDARSYSTPSGMIQTTTAAAGGLMKVWNGSAWVEKPVKVWTGSAWVAKPVKVWNGSAWVLS